jgi:parallel beta-helix repeat protein
VPESEAPYRSDRSNTQSSSDAQRGARSLLALVFILSLLAAIVPQAGADLRRSTCRGVRVSPDRNLQALIDAKPRRTTFCFAKGLYLLSSTIWTGDKFPTLDLRAGAVMDGQNGDFVGINGGPGSGDRPGTVIRGGVFQHFGNANAPSWVAPVIVTRNGLVVGTEFRENFNAGLAVQGSNARVSRVYTHHNGRYGLVVTQGCDGCPGPVGVIIENSEIAFNNTRRLSPIDDAGGTKFSGGTDGMIVRRNKVHDNFGSGLWWDLHNRNARVYGNVIYGNRNWGIMYELSQGGTRIHDNTLTGNGIGDGTANWGSNVQLLVTSSDGSIGGTGGIQIYDNRINGSAYPLGVITQSGSPITKDVYVHHNVMTLRASTTRVGGFDDSGTGDAANNRFDHNTYRVTDSDAHWVWDGQTLTWSEWQAAGNDVHGTRRQAG